MKQKRANHTGIALVIVAALSALMFFCGAALPDKKSDNTDIIARNVDALRRIEESDIVDLTPTPTPEPPEPTVTPVPEIVLRNGVMVDDLEAEKEKILSMKHFDARGIGKRFKDAVVVGDSIVESVMHYDILSLSSISAKIGIRMTAQCQQVKDACKRRPKVMFLVFGVNDIQHYQADYMRFVKPYAECVQNIRKVLPDTAIYVHAVFPNIDVKYRTYYQYRDQYNEALQMMCDKLGAYYIDGSFIAQAKPELFEEDGLHFKKNFYAYWLTYLADVAGL